MTKGRGGVTPETIISMPLSVGDAIRDGDYVTALDRLMASGADIPDELLKSAEEQLNQGRPTGRKVRLERYMRRVRVIVHNA